MTGKGGLTVEAMKELWKKEFLPSIRREMKAEIDSVKTDIKKIEARFDKIEESQAFLSDKYDGIIETLQSSKKQAAAAEAKGDVTLVDLQRRFSSPIRNVCYTYQFFAATCCNRVEFWV